MHLILSSPDRTSAEAGSNGPTWAMRTEHEARRAEAVGGPADLETDALQLPGRIQ
jgi:hypothetical protein